MSCHYSLRTATSEIKSQNHLFASDSLLDTEEDNQNIDAHLRNVMRNPDHVYISVRVKIKITVT